MAEFVSLKLDGVNSKVGMLCDLRFFSSSHFYLLRIMLRFLKKRISSLSGFGGGVKNMEDLLDEKMHS